MITTIILSTCIVVLLVCVDILYIKMKKIKKILYTNNDALKMLHLRNSGYITTEYNDFIYFQRTDKYFCNKKNGEKFTLLEKVNDRDWLQNDETKEIIIVSNWNDFIPKNLYK